MALSYKSLANSALAVNLSARHQFSRAANPFYWIRYRIRLNLTGFSSAPAPHRAYR